MIKEDPSSFTYLNKISEIINEFSVSKFPVGSSADEPTGNLDTENSLMISDILFKYVKEEGSSLIMVTHDPKLANKAKRKIKIKDGKIK